MNFNQKLINIRAKSCKNVLGVAAFKSKQIMGPPKRPAPKKKSVSTPSSATNWGRSHHSILANSSAARTATTTPGSSSLDYECRIVMAITEGRGDARCEIGIACIDLSLPTLILCQISDMQSYINTLTKINIFNPTEIIFPSTFLESIYNRLVDKVKKRFTNIKLSNVPRKTFNKSNGLDQILRLCLPSANAICLGLQHKYYALSAASALITYLQTNLNVLYASESINVTYEESEGYAVIDVSTADRLELVSCTKPAQATRYATLFGVLNYCHTKIGARRLRSAILQPPSSPVIIEERLRCVEELIKHPQTLLSIQSVLQKITNVDQLLTITTVSSLNLHNNWSVRQLNYLLLLNGLVDLVEPLKEFLENCQQPFFKELKKTLESEILADIKNEIKKLIHPSARIAKNEAGIQERCFAIRSGINGLLDLVRKTYSERLEDMREYVKLLGDRHKLPLTLANNNTKGYHIVLKLNHQQKRHMKKSDLPEEFIQVYRLAASFTMKTTELINYSTRLEDIMMEILKISNAMINKTVVDLKQYIGFFYKLCEDVAVLDMLQSLAEASKRHNYVRPKFGEFTELSQARHPMLELLIDGQVIANQISICKDYNVQIITGPNGSGKSIYIRQAMLLQVMAQIGCYVPADSAFFRPANRMFARVYLEDNMECGASAFVLEMKEIKYMMTLLTENSFFIVDELCRSTSAEEGTALAMAICEEFSGTSAFLYVTTHYISLTKLYDIYLNVKTWQMETISTGDNPEDLKLNYKFRLLPGVTILKHYGVHIVKNIWPQSVRNEVYRTLRDIKSSPQDKDFKPIDDVVRLKYKLESDLRKLKCRSKLTRAEINKHLNDYRNELERRKIFLDFQESAAYDNNQAFANNFSCDEQENEIAEHLQNAFETSSYKNLSDFLNEDSDNVNKLIPQISIITSDGELSEFHEPAYSLQISQPNYMEIENISKNHEITIQSNCMEFEDRVHDPQLRETSPLILNSQHQPIHSLKIFEMEGDLNQSMNHEFTSESNCMEFEDRIYDSQLREGASSFILNSQSQSIHCSKTFGVEGSLNDFEPLSQSTYTKCENGLSNLCLGKASQHTAELKSVLEDLRNCRESFFNDEEFDFSQVSYHTAKTSFQHIIPQVKIINGPDAPSQSSASISSQRSVKEDQEIQEMLEDFAESITYSPLNSPSQNKTTSSSLHFMAEKNKNITIEDTKSLDPSLVKNSNNGTSSNENLEYSSKNQVLDNISLENLKTNSEKPLTNDECGMRGGTTSTSVKESDESIAGANTKPKKITLDRKAIKLTKRFVPPRKLTKREIEEEFFEQDKKIYENSSSEDCQKYLSRILNRPSVRQVQNSKHLAVVRRTETGVEVIPTKPKQVKRKKTFKRMLSSSTNNIDVTIFSDENAKRFEQFVNSNERDVKKFKFNLNSNQERKGQFESFHFKPLDSAEDTNNQYGVNNSQAGISNLSFTPDGYYKENKKTVEEILNKYLQKEENNYSQARSNGHEASIFESCTFDADLDL